MIIFTVKDKKHGDLQNEWIEQFITDKNSVKNTGSNIGKFNCYNK